MRKLRNYYFLLMTSLILLFLGFLLTEETFDINVHDIYYVISSNHLYWLISLLLFFFFLIYLLFDKAEINFGKLFSKVHIFGTLTSVVGLLFPSSVQFATTEFPLYDNFQYINLSMTISILVFLMLQILFIINIFVILTKRFFKMLFK